MLTRRHLLASGLAAGATLASGLASGLYAHEADLASVEAVPEWMKPRIVAIRADLPAGEIHVDPDRFALYWTLGSGEALRYAVGIGRPGLYEPGVFYVGAKKEWPSWTPTPEMVARQPELYARYAEEGMPGGPDNPLGARALYLFTPERGDTFLRIHGTNAPETIGTAVSNGCARLLNDHIVDLYNRVPEGAAVYLYPPSGLLTPAA